MRVALILNRDMFTNQDLVPILGVELVDPTRVQTSAETGGPIVINDNLCKLIVDNSNPVVRKYLFSNFDQFKYKKSTGGILNTGSSFGHRQNIIHFDKSIPLACDRLTVPLG